MYSDVIFYGQFVIIFKTFTKNQTLKIKNLSIILSIKNDLNIIDCFVITRETKKNR